MQNTYILIFKKIPTFIFCLIFLSIGLFSQTVPLQIGQSAPDFKLRGVDNKFYTLSDFSTEKILVIIFTCNHCPTTQAYEERIIQMVNDYYKQGVGFIAIMPNYPDALIWEELAYTDLGDTFEEMKERADNMKYNFLYLYDGDSQVTVKDYGISVLPHVMVFDEERKLRYSGRIDNVENPYSKPAYNDCRTAIETILAGKEIQDAETKAFGCQVKWISDTSWKLKVNTEWAEKNVYIKEINTAGIKKYTENYTENLLLLYFWSLESEASKEGLCRMVSIHRSYNQRFFELITFNIDNPDQKDSVINVLKTCEAAVKNYIIKSNDNKSLIESIVPAWDDSLPLVLLVEPGGKIIAVLFGDEVNSYELRKKIIASIGRYYANN